MESIAPNVHNGNKLSDFRFLFIVLQVIGVTLIILMFSWVFMYLDGLAWSSKPSIQFNWHPLLMTIAMIYLYGNSILIYRCLRYVKKRSLKLTHASIFGTILLFVIIAAWAVFDSHNLANPPMPNLYSLHSWLGLGAIILFMLQWIGGFFSFLFPMISAQKRESFMPTHIYFGLAGYILAVVSALLGLCEKAIWRLGKTYSDLPNEAAIINTMGILMAVFAGLVVYLSVNKDFKRIPLAEDTMLLTGHDE